MDGEWADYSAIQLVRQLDLLDRRSIGVEAGAAWGDAARVRIFGGWRSSHYQNQKTFDPADPDRRDHTVRAGLRWGIDVPVIAEIGVEGTINRSNSARPEYDAIAVRSVLSVALPFEVGATLLAVVTAKSYVNETDFKLLVPGEEADNASVVYLDLARPFTPGIDGSLRLGWTRAEADVGDAYFLAIRGFASATLPAGYVLAAGPQSPAPRRGMRSECADEVGARRQANPEGQG